MELEVLVQAVDFQHLFSIFSISSATFQHLLHTVLDPTPAGVAVVGLFIVSSSID